MGAFGETLLGDEFANEKAHSGVASAVRRGA
jgi:hypothetical protein